MARTPSMTPAQAEALLGVRGSLVLTGDNRDAAKKWLCAMGIPSAAAATMRYSAIAACYNDTTNTTLNSYIARIKADADEEESTSQLVASNGNAAPAIAPIAPASNDAGATLAALVAPYISSQVQETVLRAVERRLESVSTIRIEVVRTNGETHVVDGYQHPKFATLLRMATARQHDGFVPGIFISGEASSGKTTGCKMLAKALGLNWYFNGAISMPHEMLGFIDAGGTYHRTPFRDAYEYGGLFDFDEVDRSDPVALLGVNPHLANGVATFPDAQIKRHKDCIIVATANTWGLGADANYSGATKLDAAFLSRFPMRLHWDIDVAMEVAISGNEFWANRVIAARRRAREAGLKVMIDTRMTQAGAALIAAGFSADEAAEVTYLANLKPDQRKIVEGK
jgi:hypothetical protein